MAFSITKSSKASFEASFSLSETVDEGKQEAEEGASMDTTSLQWTGHGDPASCALVPRVSDRPSLATMNSSGFRPFVPPRGDQHIPQLPYVDNKGVGCVSEVRSVHQLCVWNGGICSLLLEPDRLAIHWMWGDNQHHEIVLAESAHSSFNHRIVSVSEDYVVLSSHQGMPVLRIFNRDGTELWVAQQVFCKI